MDRAFWLERWVNRQLAFHNDAPHPELVRHWPDLAAGPRVFVPLCGKSLDLAWLAERGHHVVGIELSPLAVTAFFAERALVPTRTTAGAHERYDAGPYTLFRGDLFELDAATLGPFDALYDRAALIALPPAMRVDYAAALSRLAPGGTRALLVSVDYALDAINPPPFAVNPAEIEDLYRAGWRIEARGRVPTLVKDAPGEEHVYFLERLSDAD